jgi:hypothetical protein
MASGIRGLDENTTHLANSATRTRFMKQLAILTADGAAGKRQGAS